MTALAVSLRRKLRALLELAEADRGGTPAERRNALDKARQLAERHGLALDDVAGGPDGAGDVGEGRLSVAAPTGATAWASLLMLDAIAAAYGVTVTRDYARRQVVLVGPREDTERVRRTWSAAFAAVEADHTALRCRLTRTARRARRFLDRRFPDPAYHEQALGELRYWPLERLVASAANVLHTTPRGARPVAHALRAGHVAPVDAPADDVELAFFMAALDEVRTRARALDAARRPRRPHRAPDEPLTPDHPVPPPAPSPSARRRRAPKPRPLPTEALAAGSTAGARAPLGLDDLARA